MARVGMEGRLGPAGRGKGGRPLWVSSWAPGGRCTPGAGLVTTWALPAPQCEPSPGLWSLVGAASYGIASFRSLPSSWGWLSCSTRGLVRGTRGRGRMARMAVAL